MKATIETKELENIRKKYANVDMGKVGDVIIEVLEENYDKRQNYNGSAMRPLLPKTIAAKKRLGGAFPSHPLILTGQLQHSNIKNVSKKKVEVTVADKSRGKVTNNQILDFQMKSDRNPFGRSKEMDKRVDAELDKQLG